MSSKKPSAKSALIPTTQSQSPLKLENELDRKDATPLKKVKLNEIIQIGVVGSAIHGDCAIEIKNGYAM
jgi:hypothetical protein